MDGTDLALGITTAAALTLIAACVFGCAWRQANIRPASNMKASRSDPDFNLIVQDTVISDPK